MTIDGISESDFEMFDASEGGKNFYQIESHEFYIPALDRTVQMQQADFYLNSTTEKVIAVSRFNKGAEIRLEKEWGGKDDPKTTGSLNGFIEDKKGNHLNLNFERNNEGRNKAGISGGYDDRRKMKTPDQMGFV